MSATRLPSCSPSTNWRPCTGVVTTASLPTDRRQRCRVRRHQRTHQSFNCSLVPPRKPTRTSDLRRPVSTAVFVSRAVRNRRKIRKSSIEFYPPTLKSPPLFLSCSSLHTLIESNGRVDAPNMEIHEPKQLDSPERMPMLVIHPLPFTHQIEPTRPR